MASRNSITRLTPVVNDPQLLEKLEQAGAKFVTLEGKRPKVQSWNDGQHCVKLKKQEDRNLGLLHSVSNTMSLDVDDYERSKKALKLLGFDLDAILSNGWQIFSPKPNRRKAIFAAPIDAPEPKVRAFSGYDDSDKTITLLELREGAVQDFIYGVHPDTGTSLSHAPFNGFPPFPQELMTLRHIYDLPDGRGQVASAAGLRPITVSDGEPGHLRYHSDHRNLFNAQHDAEVMLEAAGYKRVGSGKYKGRWIRNGSSTGQPGIWLVEGKRDLYINRHAGDPLEGLFDPWTINVVYNYGGDLDAAEAAELVKRKERLAKAHEKRKAVDERLVKETGLGTEYKLGELLDAKIKPLNWVVQDLLPPGLTLLAAPAKTGKSYLVLQLAAAVAGGRTFLGKPVRNGPVMYFDLESSPRMQKQRIVPIIQANDVNLMTAGNNLKFRTDFSRGAQAAAEIREYMESRSDLALVIVDVFAKVRDDDGAAASKGVYQADYAVFEEFRNICNDYPELCLLFVHHTNKGNYDNAFDSVSGSMGMQGVTNTNWVLGRLSSQGITDQATKDKIAKHLRFSAVGKEMNAHDFMIRHKDELGGWELSDLRPDEVKLTAKRQEIVELFGGDVEKRMTSTEIHEELGGNINTLRNTLKQMVTAGQLRVSAEGPPSERGYSLPGAQTERKF